jgi:hypothetical protein
LLLSFVVSTHEVPHLVVTPVHESVQTPEEQNSPVAQALLQTPQCDASVRRL